MDMPDIPDFLLAKNRPHDPKEYRATRMRAKKEKHKFGLPLTMDATAWAILRELEKARDDKKKARLAALKEWKAAQ